MLPTTGRVFVWFVVAASIAACAQVAQKNVPALQWQHSSCARVFPLPLSLQAIARFGDAASQRTYVLALVSRPGGFDLALFTPQGLPAATVECYGAQPVYQFQQAQAEVQLDTRRVLVYLRLLLEPEESLLQALPSAWQMVPVLHGRLFRTESRTQQDSRSLAWVVEANSSGPGKARLTDAQGKVILALEFLEKTPALH